jgi:hypothetical protein
MISRRSQRIRKPKVIWEAAEDPTPPDKKKRPKKLQESLKKKL